MTNSTPKYCPFIIIICLWCSASFAQEKTSTDTTTARYVTIDNIFIIGNRRTKETIILRELTVKKGMLLYQPDLAKHLVADQLKIYNTRLFNSVKISTLDLSPDKVDVVVQVDERWYTFPIPILKFADLNFNDWIQTQNRDLSRLNYGMKFAQYNVRGRNEKLKLSAQFGFTRNYALSYRIPYIDPSQKNGLEVNVGYSERKSTAYTTVDHRQVFSKSDKQQFQELYAVATYTRRSRFYDFHNVLFEFNKSEISDSLNLLNPKYFSNGELRQRYLALRYRYTKDKRDVAAYPLKGFRVQADMIKIGLGIFNELDILDLRLAHDRYFHIGKNYYISTYTKGVISTPNNQSYSLFPSLGRQRDFVRGYELYLIEGSSYALNKISFKKQLLKGVGKLNIFGVKQFKTFPYAIYLKTYFDAAYVNNFNQYEQSNRFTNRIIHGAGIGLDFVTWYDFVLRTEYSINDMSEHGFFIHFKKGF